MCSFGWLSNSADRCAVEALARRSRAADTPVGLHEAEARRLQSAATPSPKGNARMRKPKIRTFASAAPAKRSRCAAPRPTELPAQT